MHIYIHTLCMKHTHIHSYKNTYIYTHIHKYLCPIIRFWSRDFITKVLVSVSRPSGQGLGLGLEIWWPRSWSWSRDLVAKVLVLVSRPGGQGLGLGLESWWPRSWSWSRAFFKGLGNKSGSLHTPVGLHL